MEESSFRYNFKSEDVLKFELLLRKEIAASARALDRSGFGFAVFSKSQCNPEYWNRENNGGFSLKQGKSPSKAIRNIFENGRLYRNECATAMVIVYYGALLSVFKDRFDETFPYIYLMDWYIIDPLLQGIGYPRKAHDMLIGDRAYFKNPDVHPETMWLQGENVIVLAEDLYYGHGIGIANAETFIEILNRNRKEGAAKSAYLMDEVARPDFELLSDVYHERTATAQTIYWRNMV
jgi:protein-glutamine gamma-glutamyltransferase